MTADKARSANSADPAPRFVNTYVAYLLARTSQLISAEFHQALAARKIPVMHWRVLAALSDGPMSVSELADIVLEKQPTMSRILLRMESIDLVQRQPGTTDKRSTLVSITTEGKRVVKPLLTLARRHERAVLAPLGPDHAQVLIDALQQLIALHSV
jgi:DNA-binding MarR family transcriptional regulator